MAWITNPCRAIVWRLALPYFQGISAEIDQHRDSLAGEIDQRLHAELASPRNEADPAAASRLTGLGKDVVAVAHRLAGLEEEAGINAQAVRRLNDQVAVAAAEARNAAACLSALREEVRSSNQLIGERIDALIRANFPHLGEKVVLGHGNLVLVPYVAGTHVLVRQHDLIGHEVVAGKEWEPHVRAAIERTARPEGVAVDAGAYVGLHTVIMSRCFGVVHAFEPQRGIFHLLCGNLALNGCINTTAHNLALYDHAGPMRLAPPERQEVPVPMLDGQPDYGRISNAAALTFEPVGDGFAEVRAVALDDLALERLALIKVDTQGADLRVLRGAENTIRRCRPTVLFEWERDLGAQHGATLEEYHAFFATLDYDVTILQETLPGRQVDYLATPR